MLQSIITDRKPLAPAHRPVELPCPSGRPPGSTPPIWRTGSLPSGRTRGTCSPRCGRGVPRRSFSGAVPRDRGARRGWRSPPDPTECTAARRRGRAAVHFG